MQCSSCGTSLPPGANNCPHCGAPVFQSNPFQETTSPPPMPGTVLAGPYTPGSSYPPANPSPLNYEQQVYPPQPMQQQPYYAGGPQAPYTVPPVPPFPPPIQRQPGRGLSRGLTILLAILALLIMSSGFGLIYYSTVYHPNQLHMQATSTAQTLQTREARATAVANAQATGTAVAIANATATAQAQATAAAVATATALQNIYTSATNKTPALNDSLAFNTGSGWDEDLAQGGGGCGFSGGAYHASLDSKGFYFPCVAENTNFGNFAFQVRMTIVSGDAGGLVFRSDRANFKLYFLVFNSDGTYTLIVSKDRTHNSTLAYGNSSTFKQGAGQTNLLTIVVRGSNMYIYVNKQYIDSVSDNTYQSGQIGVLVDTRTTSTDVAFSNAQVWKL